MQAVHPVSPIFFLEVTHNHTSPIWSHCDLVPKISPQLAHSLDSANGQSSPAPVINSEDDSDDEQLVIDTYAYTGPNSVSAPGTFEECFTEHTYEKSEISVMQWSTNFNFRTNTCWIW